MRYWYDCRDDHDRQRLASTIFFFLLAANGVLLAVSLLIAPIVSEKLFDRPGYTLALQLVLLNTFAIGFTFIPFHVMRIRNEAGKYSGLALARSVTTLVGRLVMVVGFGYGVMGIVITDVIVSTVLLIVLLPSFTPLIRGVFSRPVLRSALSFGLPRVPHGFALQVMSVADRLILQKFRSTSEIGLYSVGVSFGLVPKIALAAFEAAWAPFYYAVSREADAKRVFSTVATYGIAILALMTAGLSAIGTDLLTLMTRGEFSDAGPVVTWTAVGVFFYGIYLLTSIGLNITSQTRYYPVSTTIGAAMNVGLNLVLVPQYGMFGAAWANAASYAVQCAIAYHYSQRFYPIPHEFSRILRAVASAAVAYLAATRLPAADPLIGVFTRGTTVLVLTGVLLWITGFFRAEELQRLSQLRARRRATAVVTAPADTNEMAGEIVSVDVPDQVVLPPKDAGR
jgi:O-antigen/teichoic acid export membrane protein